MDGDNDYSPSGAAPYTMKPPRSMFMPPNPRKASVEGNFCAIEDFTRENPRARSQVLLHMANILKKVFEGGDITELVGILMSAYEPLVNFSCDQEFVALCKLASMLIDVVQDVTENRLWWKRPSFIENMKSKAAKKGESCKECGKTVEKGELVMHNERAHMKRRVNNGRFECKQCREVFNNSVFHRDHENRCQLTASADLLLICPLCSVSCNTAALLCKHRMQKHAGTTLPFFGCSTCNAWFPTSMKLERHFNDRKCGGTVLVPRPEEARKHFELEKRNPPPPPQLRLIPKHPRAIPTPSIDEVKKEEDDGSYATAEVREGGYVNLEQIGVEDPESSSPPPPPMLDPTVDIAKLQREAREAREKAAANGYSSNMQLKAPCPLCKIPIKNFYMLCAHLQRIHKTSRVSWFGCGGCQRQFKTARELEAHLLEMQKAKNRKCFHGAFVRSETPAKMDPHAPSAPLAKRMRKQAQERDQATEGMEATPIEEQVKIEPEDYAYEAVASSSQQPTEIKEEPMDEYEMYNPEMALEEEAMIPRPHPSRATMSNRGRRIVVIPRPPGRPRKGAPIAFEYE